MIATKSSFLYSLNDWGDANTFFTMGKGLMNGMVPYRDLFEQKGPILYLIYGIGYLISNRTFFGIFLLEVFSFTTTLCLFYKILKLYQKENSFFLLAPLFASVFFSMRSFFHGGSVEEFAVPFSLLGIYHFLSLLKDNHDLKTNNKIFFIEGLVAGIILWMKYTFLGFWIFFGLFFFCLYIKEKKGRELLSFLLSFFLGMFFVTLLVLLYFGVHGALKDLWEDYFYLNIFLYHASSMAETSFLTKLGIIYTLITTNFQKHLVYSVFLLLGILFIWKENKILSSKRKWIFPLAFFFLLFFLYLGCVSYRYYFLIAFPFCIFGMLWIAEYLEKENLEKNSLLIFIIPLLFSYIYAVNDNIPYLSWKKEDYAQYEFLKDMEEGSTLLYYGGIDGGFYTTSGSLPTEKYFSKININYQVFPENLDSQREAIASKRVDYVIFRLEHGEKLSDQYLPFLLENYHLVKEHTQKYETILADYYLFQKNR